jgi:hypothetical protein
MTLGWVLSVHGETSLSFEKINLNCIRFYLTRPKIEISKVITHEQRVLTSFLRLDNLELILGLIFMNFGAIDN